MERAISGTKLRPLQRNQTHIRPGRGKQSQLVAMAAREVTAEVTRGQGHESKGQTAGGTEPEGQGGLPLATVEADTDDL